jgi:hypothetical protein
MAQVKAMAKTTAKATFISPAETTLVACWNTHLQATLNATLKTNSETTWETASGVGIRVATPAVNPMKI